MLEQVKEIELFEDYHFESAEIEDGRLKITASTGQRKRLADEFTGDGIDDKLADMLREGENLLRGVWDEIEGGLQQADEEHPLDPAPSLEPDEPDESVEVDVDEELDQIREEQGKPPRIAFNESAAAFVIEAFGWTTDEHGMIVHEESGDYVETYNGHIIPLASLAGVVQVDGEPVPLRDNFADLVEWVSDQK